MQAPLSNSTLESIDTHFHVFEAGQGVPGARYVPAYQASIAQWQACARLAGVGRGVLVQTSFMGTDNRLLVQTLRDHPQQLRGVAVVPPDAGWQGLQVLHASGVRGLRLNLAGRSHEAGDWAQAHSLWDAVSELGWHVEVHTDVGGLPQVLPWLPQQLPLVLDHMAKPDTARAQDPTIRAVTMRSRLSPVHIKLSGAYRLAGRPADALARLWLAELGSTRLLWGSDWPCTNHEHLAHYGELARALEAWIPEQHLKQLRVHNPATLYGFDGSAPDDRTHGH